MTAIDEAFQMKGIESTLLKEVFELFEGAFSYDVLRAVRTDLMRKQSGSQ